MDETILLGHDGPFHIAISDGKPVLRGMIGNTQTPVKFRKHPDEYMEQWFSEAPTHHCAMSIGHNALLFQKVGQLLDMKYVTL